MTTSLAIPKPTQTAKPPITIARNKVVTNNEKKSHLYSYADVRLWTFTSYKWDDQVMKILLDKFGKENFRPNQRAIINCVLSRKDVFVCMPTGYGKSLTF